MIKLGLLGATGRMGHAILDEIPSDSRFHLVAKAGSKETPEEVIRQAGIIIDFTHVDAIEKHVDLAVSYKKPLLVGTSGLSKDKMRYLEQAATSIPLLYAGNTSLGVTLLKNMVKQLAKLLNDTQFDIEIQETHHRHKIDSPSQTALMLGQAAAEGRGRNLDEVSNFDRHLVRKPRTVGEIGFASSRGGTVFGDHSVQFLGDDEVITLSHQSLSRKVFAKGALGAAYWLYTSKKNNPGFYSMDDILDEASSL